MRIILEAPGYVSCCAVQGEVSRTKPQMLAEKVVSDIFVKEHSGALELAEQ
jgi:hypothetical protein